MASTSLLSITRATAFVPGTNQRWHVTGANWTFLLPSLELGHILCIGRPSDATLATLRRIGRTVTVVASLDAGGMAAVGGATPLDPDRRFDLIAVLDPDQVRRLLDDDRPALANVGRVLTDSGCVYLDLGTPTSRRTSHRLMAGLAAAGWEGEAFGMTPLMGEVHTAVPLDDGATGAFWRDRALYSLSSGAVKRALAARLRPRRRDRRLEAAGRAQETPARASARSPRRLARAAAVGIGLLAERAEHGLAGRGWLPERVGLVTTAGGRSDERDGPPGYLRDLARAFGVDLGGWRWAVSAKGEYSSRKVLVYLFEPGAARPAIIVKLTRDAALNPRLENERDALVALWQVGMGAPATLPRVVFHGHHGGLAIVAETVIDGVPFREAARWSADCPYAGAAVDWLVRLGAATADRTSTPPREAAAVLRDLFERFRAIYRLTKAQEAVLGGQIAAVAAHPGPFPTVFQHGDPGTWNLLATPGGQVAFLDWEAAEATGMPLWDLFYVLRSYAVGTSRAGGEHDLLRGLRAHFFTGSPLTPWIAAGIARGVAAAGVPADLVGALFYSCWMHRALKEATRLPAAAVDAGHYANLLRMCLDHDGDARLRSLLDEALPHPHPL